MLHRFLVISFAENATNIVLKTRLIVLDYLIQIYK